MKAVQGSEYGMNGEEKEERGVVSESPVMKTRSEVRGAPAAARCCTEESTHSTAARASALERPCRSTSL